MFPKISPRQMRKMMRQMGMEMKELPAREVVIKLEDRTITIKEPAVSLIEVQGQRTYQVVGGVESVTEGGEPSPGDVEIVAEQAGVSREAAREALKRTEGDIAAAILELTK